MHLDRFAPSLDGHVCSSYCRAEENIHTRIIEILTDREDHIKANMTRIYGEHGWEVIDFMPAEIPAQGHPLRHMRQISVYAVILKLPYVP